ncbi:vomeronasal type-1 receptor 1-like [Trichosurus vulpecula]|uniref:vomeronasal type-1 receptor 1-like n=1 Tax=Trichosurus vulpecula TaxID=9337 RepID=UPI00186B04C1|nr:vomeronasal type-1 receptor 1-like [Trichosurus vulpecula]
MISDGIALGLLFLFQTGFGALGNSFLLGLYTITFFTGPRLRPIDLLLCHLAFANDLVLLSKGIPQIMATLGLTNFLDDVGCKLVFYFHRVARDLSLCTTCLLSSFQAFTLSPRSSWWENFKARSPKYIVPLFLSCWTFNLLKNCLILLYMKGPKGSNNITGINDFIYCSATFHVSPYILLYILLFSLPDVLYVGIMVGTSGYIVFVLYRHHQRVQYLHGNSLKPNGFPEARATQTVLLLIILFVSFYCLNSILLLCIRYGKTFSWLVHSSAFLAACFPACSSFVLIVSDSQVQKYSLALWEKMMLQF